MVTIGIRELKQQTSELIRRVRERGTSINITHHGKVVARIVPVVEPDPTDDEWAQLDQLALEIGKRWPKGVSAAQAVREARR